MYQYFFYVIVQYHYEGPVHPRPGFSPSPGRMCYCYHLWLLPIIHFDKLVSVPMFCFLIYNWRTTEGLNYVKNEPKILFLALAQRAAGGWSPSKTILDRGTTTSRIFSDLDVFNTKVNDFLGKIQVISCLSRYQPIILTNCLSSGKVWMYYFLICVIIWYRYEWHECFIFVFFHGTNHLFW